ncbi:hypothetical protein KUTeg_012052 [Tegillarca granosa]|uniref:Uncharacterized protein n=1 Tax=Tegillarca granosa TaxID=220873 RepID=A0ABQ9F1N0_TEGGR|nr:hypothetical protein KUTeg_012052 [Tegillarca granosa]
MTQSTQNVFTEISKEKLRSFVTMDIFTAEDYIKKGKKKMKVDGLKNVKKTLQKDFKACEKESKSVGEQAFQDESQLCMFHLGGELYVVAKPYNDQMLIHVREYAVDSKKCARYPTKRGIALDVEKF